jgi:endo-alpha-1,4-polygalactosaminidase (GH114 family)
MDELKIPTTAREIRNMSFEEMDAIVARFEREKERRRKAEATNVINKINDAIREAQALGFRVIIDVAASRGVDIEYNDNISIRVTR